MILGADEDIALKTAVMNIRITQRNKFFCMLFSFLVISKSGTHIHTMIQIISFIVNVSQKKKKLIAVTNIGQNVLYIG